jgi:nicotinamide-nucleotide amidase
VRIYKHDHQNRRVLGYTGEHIASDAHAVTARAVFTMPAQHLGYLSLIPGDVLEEVFYLRRFYNVFEIRSAAGALKGWYANITRPVTISAGEPGDGAPAEIVWQDLALDVWMSPDGQVRVLDEDEFEQIQPELTALEIAAARDAVRLAEQDLRERWHAWMLARIATGLTARGWRVACAESCTGGMLGEHFTRRPGSSAWFEGGVMSYSNVLKEALLGVPKETLMAYGAVSAETAAAMATGARTRLGANIGISTTGVAGPDGGSDLKPVGLVYLGLSTPENTRTERHVWPSDRAGNKAATLDQALRMLAAVVAPASDADWPA